MHFWQNTLINTAKCRSRSACSDSNPPAGATPRLADWLETTTAPLFSRSSDRGKALAATPPRLGASQEGLFLRETDAGGCYQQRGGGGGGLGEERPSGWCRTADLLGIKCVPPLRFSAICSVAGDMFLFFFPLADYFYLDYRCRGRRYRKMASRGNSSCSRWAQLGDPYRTTAWYS